MSRRAEFVRCVEEIADSCPRYRIGGDGRDGTCDCVGLAIGALRRMGIRYGGEHSSNWLPRREAVEVWEIGSVRQLTMGDVVLKARGSADPRYDLPKRFRGGRDDLDYYHAGVVTGTEPLEITHMTTPTIKRDHTLGRWSHAMMFKQLQGREENEMEEKALFRATVTTKDDPLRIRRAPETGEVIGHAPIGAMVDVLEDGSWPKIRYQGIVGYASRAFLQAELGKDDLPEGVEEGNVTTLIEKSTGQVIQLIGRWREAED